MAEPEGASSEAGGKEQDRHKFLPIASVSRIMRAALPRDAMIAKDAKEAVQECASEFISLITSDASHRCWKEQKRSTIYAEDLFLSMAKFGFEEYVEPLRIYLKRYREMEGRKKGSKSSGPN